MTEVTVVMPCLNESETLETCIKKIHSFFEREGIEGEVLVSDNGSTDGSQEIAVKNNATLVHASEKGYGSALREGINSAKGNFIIMGDADDSYDFSNLMPFILKLREGFDLVMGNRFKGGVKKNAMPFLHKYLGNPVLSFIGRLFFKIPIGDFHCGLRGFTANAYRTMDLHTTGMEFASEMVVKAALHDLKITEVPTTLSPDGRSRPPHLRTWRDGWRHLRFLLLFSPKWLFLYPGIFIVLLSSIAYMWLLISPIKLGDIILDINTLIVLSFALLIGFQLLFFHWFARVYSITSGIIPSNERFQKLFKSYTLERGLVIGGIIAIFGAVIMIYNLYSWGSVGFSDLEPTVFVRKILLGITPFVLGIQIMIYSFVFSIIGIKGRK